MNTANKVAVGILGALGLFIAGVVVVVGNSTTESARAYFDNGLDQTVKVAIDGKEAATLPAHSASIYESLPVGKHTVSVVGANGKQIEEKPIEVPAAKGITDHRWVYNIAGKSEYRVSYIAYGNREPDEGHDLPAGQTFFELPDTSAVFLPAEAAYEKAKAGTQLAVVGHRELHKDWPCCKNLRALVASSKK